MTRVLALSLSAILAAGSLSFAAVGTANAAPTDSSVVIPIVGAGEVTISKTKDLADGEEITISGRLVQKFIAEPYIGVNQAGTEYRPIGSDVVPVTEGVPLRVPLVAGAVDPDIHTFTTSYTVRSSLVGKIDGTSFDGRVQQTYLLVGGFVSTYGDIPATLLTSNATGVNAAYFVPLTFEGGSGDLKVDSPVSITANPSSIVADLGQTVTFEAGASGDPEPDLQWEVSEDNGQSWSTAPGENAARLTRTVALADDGLQFRLRAGNRTGKAFSAPAVLSVNIPATEPGEVEPEEPFDPTKIALANKGSWARVTPLTGLADGQRVRVEASYSKVPTDSGVVRTPLPLAQIVEATGGEPTSRAKIAILASAETNGKYLVDSSFAVTRYLTAEDGAVTDCFVTQCYLGIGGDVYDAVNFESVWTPGDVPGAYFFPSGSGGLVPDNTTTKRVPIFFEGTELVPPPAPEPPQPEVRNLPAFPTQPADVTVAEGYAAQFEPTVTGDPAPTFQWQRSVDGGASWQTIRGATLPSIRVVSSLDLDGYQYRVRATNEVGTAYSTAAKLVVTPGAGGNDDPNADYSRKGVSLDWIGSPELQRLSPAYTPNYYSAGVSEGNKATYKNAEGNAVVVYRAADGSESVQTYSQIRRFAPGNPSAPPTGNLQLVRLNNGIADRSADGGGTVRWNATWSINNYGGLVPFTLTDPVLTWDAQGAGTLTADLGGYGSSRDNPDIKFPLEPALDVPIATFSNVSIDAQGTFTATPDYAGVTVEVPSDVAEQDRTAEGWGSWPQAFVDFQVKTGLSSYWYSSGGAADRYKAPSPITVAGLTGFVIAPAVPAAPAAPTVTAVSGTALAVSWVKPVAGGEPTGYTVTATHGDAVTTVDVDGAALSTSVTGLDLGTEYAVTVTAKNAAGSSPASAPTTATTHGTPAVPSAPVLAPGEGTSLVATWEAPASDGGSPVTGYDVTLRSGGEVVATRTVDEAAATFEGLARGAAYTATVAARNALGASAPSAASAPVTVAALAPSAPETPVVTSGVGSLVVAWTAPDANGSDITGYTVTAAPKDAGSPVSTDVTALTATLTGLVRGGEYDVTVVARNAVGASPASPTASATTLAAAPSDLGAPSVTTVSGAELLVAWVAPGDDGGAPITGYDVTVRRGSTVVTTVSAAADASSVTVGGLSRGTEYTATVTARNATGSVESPASAVVRTFDVPAAPEATADLIGPNGVEVSWTAPADGGSAIVEYVVTVRSGDAVLDTRLVEVGDESVTIDGIAPGTPVTASVVARNAVGDSAAGTTAIVTVPAVAPDAPAVPVIRAVGDESVVVTWSAPVRDGGSPITGYRVSLVGPDGVTVVEAGADARSAEIGDLSFGSYAVSVVAVSAAGTSEPSLTSAAVKVVGSQPNGSPELVGVGHFDTPSAGDVEAAVSGGAITISVPGREGEWVGVSIHSDPRFLGWHRVTNGVVTVAAPAGFTGAHHVVVYDADGVAIGYDAVDLGAPTGEAVLTPTGTGDTRAGLAKTGADLNPTWSVLAILLLLSGAGALAIARRPRLTRPRG